MRASSFYPLLTVLPLLAAADDKPSVVPLRHTHAHNDYEHKRPLFDALDHGFTSVEADIFLVNGQLLIGHTSLTLDRAKTLEKLYLDPLKERIQANQGRVYRSGPPVFLLIDLKTEPKATCAALDQVLARYADILSVVRDGKLEEKAVSVVITGLNENRSRQEMLRAYAAQPVRYAGIDGRMEDLDSTVPAHLMPWISDRWTKYFHGKGEVLLTDEEKAKLREFVQKAHERGRLLRFWATAENPAVWKELLANGVDLINTDKLEELERFLRANVRTSGVQP